MASHGLDQTPFPGGQSRIFMQSANGQLLEQTQTRLPIVNAFTHDVAAADVNGDGSIDLYLSNLCCTDPGPRLYINDGTGHFTATSAGLPSFVAFRTPSNVYNSSRFIDLNNDGYPDLVLGSDPLSADNLVLLNDGHGNFTPAANILPAKYGGLGWATISITVADFNGDGYPDLLMVMTKNVTGPVFLQLLLNNHDGTFRDASSNIPQDFPTNVPTGWIEWALATDINGDGWTDIVTNGGGYSPHLYVNNGDGTFTDATEAMPVLQDAQVLAGDFIGNGKVDLFFSLFNGNYGFARNLSPILPTSNAAPGPFRPVPAITSLSTTSVLGGTSGFTLTVSGSGFFSGVSVGRWNGSPRTTTYVSASQLTMVLTTADFATGGRFAVTVWNPQPGGGVSPASFLTVIACTFQLSPSSISPSGNAASGTITVTGPAGCPWTAVSNSGFLAVTSGTPGNGNGTVGYSVAANTGFGRTGTLTIAGQTFTASQFSGKNEVDASAATSQADAASIPIYLNLISGANLPSLTVTATITPGSGVPALTGSLSFSSDTASPTPAISTNGSNAITLTYTGLTSSTSTVHLGNIIVNVPRTAVNGQTYTVDVSGTVPGGPDAVLTVAAQLPAWTGHDKIALASYFYWYDVNTGSYTVENGSDLLTLHPPAADLSTLDYNLVSWHQQQLADMTAAGIDVALPVYRADSGSTTTWSQTGLRNMVTAAQALIQAGTPGPMIGMFDDTSSLPDQNNGIPPDATTDAGKTLLYQAIHDFFSIVPPNLWATIDGKPIVVLYSSSYVSNYDQSTFDYIVQHFQADFGANPYLIREISWQGVTTDAAYQWGAALDHPYFSGDVVEIGPGFNETNRTKDEAGPTGVPRIRDRDCGLFYQDGWDEIQSSSARLVMIETWNELIEATGVCNSQEYGRQFVSLSAARINRWKTSAPYVAPATLQIDFGRDEFTSGLRPLETNIGDGVWKATYIAGHEAASAQRTASPPSYYLYLSVDNSFTKGVTTPVWVTVEYLDTGSARWWLDYDGASAAYTQTAIVPMTNSGAWKLKTFFLPDARFQGQENQGADLRIDDYNTAGESHYFSRVWITKTAPPAAVTRMSPLADVVLPPGASMDLPLTAASSDGAAVSFTLSRGPGFASLRTSGGTSMLHLAPTVADVQTCPNVVTAVAATSGSPLADAASFRVTVVPFPSISSLSAASALAGAAGFTVTVNGANFTATSQVQWGAAGLATAFVSATQLTAAIPTPDLVSPGTFNVTVTDPSSGASNAVPFAVAASCTFHLSSANATAPSAASTGSTTVTAPVGCAWTGSANTGFLMVTSGASGTGNGALGYSVTANTGLARTGTLTVAGQTFTVNQSSGINELDSAAAATSPGNVVHIPLTLSLASGISVSSLSLTVTLTPVSGAPGPTIALSFSNDPAQPVPASSAVTATSITLTYTNSSFSGTLHLGDVLATLPGTATLGQTYTIHLSGITAPVSAGADNVLTVATLYLVGDVFPSSGDSAGNFGDGIINTLDLLAALRAITGIPGSVPAKCSDRFDAIDAYPVDVGSVRGGDGLLNTLDLLVILRRVAHTDTSLPTRTSRSCPSAEPAAVAPEIRDPEGILESIADGARTAIYLRANSGLSLLGLSFALGAEGKLQFMPGQLAPSVTDTGLPGILAAAWLEGIDLKAGDRILLGYVDSAGPIHFFGVSANDRNGRSVPIQASKAAVR
jgi:hypothetical protein